jgi:thiamine biosynthesis lipoprotein
MKRIYIFLSVIFIFSCKKNDSELIHNKFSGNIFGTYYNIQFYDTKYVDYNNEIDSLFTVLNNSMSTYQSNSLISLINKGDKNIEVDTHFKNVFNTAKRVYEVTNGVFDPTIGDVVNAWSFGPKTENIKVDSVSIDSLMKAVGFGKVTLTSDNLIQKENSNSYLDFNAIAKGYALDVIADFLNSKNHNNHLIDIGGEVLAKGTKPNKIYWKVGIDKPNFEGYQETQKIINLSDVAMATSGVYRKFKVGKDGKKYAHIINPQTGYPSKTNILSVSVIAQNCMIADAYATAFQIIGIEGTKIILKQNKYLKVYFIYDDNGIVKTLTINDFPS